MIPERTAAAFTLNPLNKAYPGADVPHRGLRKAR